MRALAGLPANGSARAELEQVLEADEGRGAAFSPEERTMLRAVLRLGDLRVDDVMVPRADIDAVDTEISVGDLMGAFRKAGHSRMPIYRDTLDDPIGMAHIKDVMGWIADTADMTGKRNGKNTTPFDLSAVDLQQTLTAANIVRPILFVPPSMPVRMLLERMQASRTQMALVIDEYGGTDGLVSLEDLVETIFGEIEDEHDIEEELSIREIQDGQYEADARVSVEDAQEAIGQSLYVEDDDDIDTIGGFIFAAISRIPVTGEILHIIDGYEVEILDADPRRIRTVRIRKRRRSKTATRGRTRAASEAAEPVSPGSDTGATQKPGAEQLPVPEKPEKATPTPKAPPADKSKAKTGRVRTAD
ncbi:MAG: transporter associated domain-containing protein [Alphaproteobacteria bacterium]